MAFRNTKLYTSCQQMYCTAQLCVKSWIIVIIM